jgi:cell division control protein 45
MYLPRSLIGKLYTHLVRTRHLLSPTILILVALEPDALCACRILTTLLKRDYIPHKIKPIAGYADLANAGKDLVQPMRSSDGGSGGVVICLGVGGLVDLEQMLGLEVDENGNGGAEDVEVWVLDARRPWNLSNVFGGLPQDLLEETAGDQMSQSKSGIDKGRITHSYTPGKGGIIVFDDGDIEAEMSTEQEAYWALAEMPDVDDEDIDSDLSDSENEEELGLPPSGQGQKRKTSSDGEESDDETQHPRQKRRSNSVSVAWQNASMFANVSQSEAILSSPGPRDRPMSDRSSEVSRRPSHASGSSSPLPGETTGQPSVRTLRRRLLRMRRKHQRILGAYETLGTSYSEPISSLVYTLAAELGRADNDLLWHAITGVSSMEIYGRTMTGVGITRSGGSGRHGDRGEQIREVLRDEVRRLNPVDPAEWTREQYTGDTSKGGIPTHARSPTDTAIRLSPEPRFLLIRHWSLYDSMLHSPYLAARLGVWSEKGRRRLHKLLATMGISLVQCRQTYTHMDMDLKRELRNKLLECGPLYGLEELAPPVRGPGDREGWGFVRCWGWKACLSATDVAAVVGSILEVGDPTHDKTHALSHQHQPVEDGNTAVDLAAADVAAQEAITARFFKAYDALGSVDKLTAQISTAQHLHRAILRTGSALIEKRQIRHLRAFRMAVVREGPDVELFTHPGALVKLALWLAEAIEEKQGRRKGKKGEELLVAGLDEARGVYVVVGLGGGGGQSVKKRQEREEKLKAKEKKREEKRAEREKKRAEREDQDDEEPETEEDDSDDSDSDSDDEESLKKGPLKNRFGNAFQEVIEETGSRVRVDSFEHCVVEVKKEDLSGFLESLSMKTVVA